jgi:HAE1 family hydrophobic/amphiphilic exporter-1
MMARISRRRLVLSVLGVASLSAQAAGVTLSQALQEALANGPDAQLVRNSRDSAKEYERSVRSAALPVVTGSASAGLGYQDNATADLIKGLSSIPALSALKSMAPSDDPYYSYSVGVKVMQPLVTFGKVSTALRMASTYDRITTANASSQQQAIQQSVVDAWFAAVLARAKLDVTEKSVARQVEVLTTLERNFALGSGMKAQVLQAKSRLIQTRQVIVAARSNAVAARKALNRLLSRPADDTVPLDTAGLSQFEAMAAPAHDALVKEAFQNRKDLRTMEEMRSLLGDVTFIKKATYYPTIGLQGAFGFDYASQNASDITKLLKWDSRNWSIGVGMNWTIFDGWSGSGEAGAARAAERSMDINIANVRRGIDINADIYLREKEAADSGLVAAREAVDAASEAYGLYQSNFKAGSGQLSDVLSSEDDLRTAELGLLSARLDVTKACIHLTLIQGKPLVALPEIKS